MKKCIVIFGENEFENLKLILKGWIRNLEMFVMGPGVDLRAVKTINRVPFIKRYIKSIKNHNVLTGDYKGLGYEIHEEAIDLTIRFYDERLKSDTRVIAYYARLLNTNRFEAYIKKQISLQIFTVLKDLHRIRLSCLEDNNILLSKNPINEFIIAYMEHGYSIKYNIRWVSSGWGLFSFFIYYNWLFIEFMKRGMVFNKERKNYKLSMEAAWGFYRKTLRNDILIDNDMFKSKDILILKLHTTFDPGRIRAFKEAKERDFDTASLPELKININRNIFTLLSFYFLTPVKIFFRLFSKRQSYFFYYIFLFHKKCFPIELLMNLFKIKCNISIENWGGIEETIVLNKYGAKNVIFHWSDLTFYKAYNLAFTSHNVFFSWSDAHYDFQSSASPSADENINVGCIFKKESNRMVNYKADIIAGINGFKKERKVVTFFDTGFSNHGSNSECFFLEYIEIIKEFCEANKNVNVLLKPKTVESYESRLSQANQNRYKSLCGQLASYDNFNYLDASKWGIEEAIAISDVCISMGMNSPSTIALICGKEGLYFDNTGNISHPFARKYPDIIVFRERRLLFKRIDNILRGKFKCKDVIGEKEIREYDTFPDDNALERIKDHLYELTSKD